MKAIKQILVITMMIAIASPALAQDNNNDTLDSLRQEIISIKDAHKYDTEQHAYNMRQEQIWTKSSPLMITYGTQNLKDINAKIEYKSDFAIGISKRRTYYLHNKAIANMLKFGVDLSMMELTMARYAKGKGISTTAMMSSMMGNVTSGTFDSYEDYFNCAYEQAQNADDDEDIKEMLDRIDVGKYQLSVSICAVGPSLRIAPFYGLDKRWLDKVKVGAYFHYVPTLSALLFTGDDEGTTCCGGYISSWRYGANISIGKFGIGIEHQWGKGNLKKWISDDDDMEESDFDATYEKRKYKTSTTRLYIGLKF